MEDERNMRDGIRYQGTRKGLTRHRQTSPNTGNE